MKKKIVIIVLGQPSTNPRTVKEATSLSEAGFEVHVLYNFTTDWAIKSDEILLKNVIWNHKLVGGAIGKNKIIYIITKLKHKLFTCLNNFGINYLTVAERTQARVYDELLYEAKKIKADWYIGHNLGALSIVVQAAKSNGAKAGFDFEDYHRGECKPNEKNDLKRTIFLENKYVEQLYYYSTASELITNITKKNHPDFIGPVINLLNCFPLIQQPIFINKLSTDTTLQLFWFSQTIGINRGLETLAKALKLLNDPYVHLTLAGACKKDISIYLQNTLGELYSNIHFAGIIEPDQLPTFSAKFDVGMAMEIPIPLNRDICLTNKVLTYLLAGNAIIFSETSMQASFNELYKVGEIFSFNNEFSLASKIKEYKNIQKLNTQRYYNYQLAARQLNWETESKKLLAIVNTEYSF